MLTLVAKTNVLTYGHDLWWRTFQDVAKEYPDIKADYNHVDACCMWMVKNPEYYDVIVTTNMFGDIITDLGGDACRAAWAWRPAATSTPIRAASACSSRWAAAPPSTPART